MPSASALRASDADARTVEVTPSPSRSLAHRRAEKATGMAFAIAWRESRRCPYCHALGYTPCAHRPDGAETAEPIGGTDERMPFAKHRTCAEWR